MVRILATFLIIGALSLLAYSSPTLQFYKMPKHKRLYSLWKKDIDHLKKKDEFKKAFLNIEKVEFNFDDPQVADELKELGSPFVQTKDTKYILKIQIIRWIDKNRFGYVLQHELFDKTNNDKLFEFGRTYRIGIIW